MSRLSSKKIFISLAAVLTGGALALFFLYGALYAGALLFLQSLEGLRFEAEAAVFRQGRITDNLKASGLREVRLEPLAGKTAEVGFDSGFPYAFGRVRVSFIARPRGGTNGRVTLRITGRAGREVLAAKQVPLKEAAKGMSLEANLGQEVRRLEFWLRYRGDGALIVDRVNVSRPDSWPVRLWRYMRQIVSSPFWRFWKTESRFSPWRAYSLPRLYERVGLLRLTGRITKGGNGIYQKARLAYDYVSRRVANQDARQTCPDVGDTHWQVLVRGGGKCDTQARVLGDMLADLGLSSRVVWSGFKPLKSGTHSLLEVAFPTGWGVFDPYSGFALMGPGDRPLSFKEIHEKLRQGYPVQPGKDEPLSRADSIRAFFANQPRTLNNRRPFLGGYYDFPRVLRQWYGDNLQDQYLRALRKAMQAEPRKFALAKARNLHLFGRFEEAGTAYRQAEILLREPLYKAALAFYQAELALDQNRPKDACRRLRILLPKAPSDSWKRRLQEALSRWGCDGSEVR